MGHHVALEAKVLEDWTREGTCGTGECAGPARCAAHYRRGASHECMASHVEKVSFRHEVKSRVASAGSAGEARCHLAHAEHGKGREERGGAGSQRQSKI